MSRAPEPEDLAHLGIDDEVHVALAVARLDVLEPVPLLGQRPERLGEERPGLDLRPSARPSASG